jgi:phosphatidylinositol alpha-1,6-mannosyltransferase
MRILLISVDFTPHRDGVSSVSYHYARGLAERGHEVTVVGPASAGDGAQDCRAPFRVYRFPGYRLGLLRLFPFLLYSLGALVRHRPDVILPMNIGYGGLFCLWLSLFGKRRFVTMAYAYEFLKFRKVPFLRTLYRAAYRRSAFTIAISRFTRERLIEFGVPADKVRVAYPGVNAGIADAPAVQVPDTQDPAAPGPVLGTCGRLIHRKGHDLVIRALPAIAARFPDVSYVIAGDGPARRDLQTLACRLGVEDRVRFLGRADPRKLVEFYRSLDLFVMPARDDQRTGHVEGFGIVFLEAAAHGVPAVATRTGGIPEAVVDGETGRLVAPEDSGALASVVIELLSDGEQLAALGAGARERATGEFAWTAQVERISRWLLELGNGTP